jgi:catechol 2,3-dioxygenase-like lactoylglutathione lyase family enzyme
MTTEQPSPLTFTKLVVDDLDAMADFYCTVFGLHRGLREQFEDGVGGEPIDEIALVAAPGDQFGSLSLLKFVNRSLEKGDEVILGFVTPDLSALLERAEHAGGTPFGKIKDVPHHAIRAAFMRDPEGHLCEIVEMSS